MKKTDLQFQLERERELTALVESFQAICRMESFEAAAEVIFSSCKRLIGASSGYLAFMTPDGRENDVVYLDAGGCECLVDPNLPMPIRGLREEAYRTGKAVYENHFRQSEWKEFLPPGHVILDNVLFAPLILEEKTVGLLGVGNKPGGFTKEDARRAASFGEHAAAALQKSRYMEQLKMQEEKYRALAQSAQDGIISIDQDGMIFFWNFSAERIFGYSAKEMIGQPLTRLIPERYREEHERGIKRLQAGGVERIIGSTLEVFGLRWDGVEFLLELSLSHWESRGDHFYTGILRDVSDRKQDEQFLIKSHSELEQKVRDRTHELSMTNTALENSREELRKLNNYLQIVREEERKEIARNIHDQLGQPLAVLKMDLAWMGQRSSKGEKNIAEKISSMSRLLDFSLTSVKRLIEELRPGLLDNLGLSAAIEWYAEEFQLRSKILCSLRFHPENILLDPKQSTMLYRIFQEAMVNILRHAEATKVDVRLEEDTEGIHLEVADNGRGITEMELSAPTSFGLIGIRERTLFFGGEVRIHKNSDGGTTLSVCIPRSPEANR